MTKRCASAHKGGNENKNVMTKAWESAKEAITNFGGKVKDYFAEALRMA